MDEAQLPSVLSWLKNKFTGDPKGQTYPASQPTQYPTDEDVDFAKKNDWSYGQPWAPEFEGKSARFLTGDPNAALQGKMGSPIPVPATTIGSNIPLDRVGSSLAPMENLYAKAALASENSALAKLGFNSNKMAIELGRDPKTVNLLGYYLPEQDEGYVNALSPSTLVHESIHRGVQKLKESPFWKPEFMPDDEELLVRHLMQSKMGDPNKAYYEATAKLPKEQQGPALKLEQTARALFDPKQSALAKKRQEQVDAMEAAAANYIAAKHPGGPR